MLEFKHVPLYKSAPNLLIGPSNEELVVVVGLTTRTQEYAEIITRQSHSQNQLRDIYIITVVSAEA